MQTIIDKFPREPYSRSVSLRGSYAGSLESETDSDGFSSSLYPHHIPKQLLLALITDKQLESLDLSSLDQGSLKVILTSNTMGGIPHRLEKLSNKNLEKILHKLPENLLRQIPAERVKQLRVDPTKLTYNQRQLLEQTV